MDIQFQCKDQKGSLSLPSGSSAQAVISTLGTPARSAICCVINGTLCDLITPLQDNDIVELVFFDDPRGREVFWHSSAHVLAQAVLRLFPQALPTIGPAIEEGFYYDFANLTISDADFERIEKMMETIIQEKITPERKVFASSEEAQRYFKGNTYKCELISEFAAHGSTITAYTQKEFCDLCRGPHLSNLSVIKAIKILKTSGAYWRADCHNEMLTRIYGISFPDTKQLQEYFERIEEAKKRDHKVLGPRLDLFSLKEEAPGIPFIHPKGMIIWNRLLDFWRQAHKKEGYIEIKTPTMMVRSLWEQSGHWQNYRDNMFTSTIEEREFAIKPMNCPGGMLFYKSTIHSYREFPLKVAEVGQVHRYEPTGSLSGLFRVRSFHQDDAHIFMRPDQIQSVIQDLLRFVQTLYGVFGLEYTLVLSTRPEANTIGTDEDWKTTTNALRQALEENGMPFSISEGNGAFYGPKIDILVFDALRRTWQCGTIQLDMALPERFDLEYTDADGTKKRPIMAHRAIWGSIERFFGNLIEFYAGKFPLWLSPVQIAIVSVADRHIDYCTALEKRFVNHGFETHIISSAESVSKKIRLSQQSGYNYIVTIGDKEVEDKTLSIRTRDNAIHSGMSIEDFLTSICEERDSKQLSSPLESHAH